MKKLLAGACMALGLVTTATAAVNCNTYPNNTITNFVNDDVVAVGYTCTIAATGSVNGNLLQSGSGGLVIRGVVNGSVSEADAGDVLIARGTVGGGILEADAGNVILRGGSTVNGGIEEAGDGSVSVVVDLPGRVNVEITESGAGGVSVTTLDGNFEGNVIESGIGGVVINVGVGTSFKGGVEEFDVGGVNAAVEGSFEGGIVERLGGNVITTGNGAFMGNSEHELTGTCSNTILNFQGAACVLL